MSRRKAAARSVAQSESAVRHFGKRSIHIIAVRMARRSHLQKFALNWLSKHEIGNLILNVRETAHDPLPRAPAQTAPQAAARALERNRRAPHSRASDRNNEAGRFVVREIAALFVETEGVYWHIPGVFPWDEQRDAKRYDGPYPVVAHPPYQRWGRMATGGPAWPKNKPRPIIGDDKGCFQAALEAVQRNGGVLEHPADSKAWPWFLIPAPRRGAGWQPAGRMGHTCYAEQGHYGHISRKPTWLYAVGCGLPELIWTAAPQRLHPTALAKYGYEKARRIGMAAMIGGKDKTKIRERTPVEFRDILIAMARSVRCAHGMRK